MTRTRNKTGAADLASAPSRTTLEVLGVAGSGKSTAARLLCALPGFLPAGFIHARRPRHLLEIVASVPRLWEILLVGATRTPRISWREVKLLAYVERWPSVLGRGSAPGSQVLVFDQGPLYAIVRLTAEAKPFTDHPSFLAWRRRALERWAQEIDVVAWLDASDEVLLTRINTREQAHQEKGTTEDAAKRFLGRYRTAFEEVLRSMDGPTVVQIDTAVTSLNDVERTIVRAIRHGRTRRSTSRSAEGARTP